MCSKENFGGSQSSQVPERSWRPRASAAWVPGERPQRPGLPPAPRAPRRLSSWAPLPAAQKAAGDTATLQKVDQEGRLTLRPQEETGGQAGDGRGASVALSPASAWACERQPRKPQPVQPPLLGPAGPGGAARAQEEGQRLGTSTRRRKDVEVFSAHGEAPGSRRRQRGSRRALPARAQGDSRRAGRGPRDSRQNRELTRRPAALASPRPRGLRAHCPLASIQAAHAPPHPTCASAQTEIIPICP